jgi:hypothetical protein
VTKPEPAPAPASSSSSSSSSSLPPFCQRMLVSSADDACAEARAAFGWPGNLQVSAVTPPSYAADGSSVVRVVGVGVALQGDTAAGAHRDAIHRVVRANTLGRCQRACLGTHACAGGSFTWPSRCELLVVGPGAAAVRVAAAAAAAAAAWPTARPCAGGACATFRRLDTRGTPGGGGGGGGGGGDDAAERQLVGEEARQTVQGALPKWTHCSEVSSFLLPGDVLELCWRDGFHPPRVPSPSPLRVVGHTAPAAAAKPRRRRAVRSSARSAPVAHVAAAAASVRHPPLKHASPGPGPVERATDWERRAVRGGATDQRAGRQDRPAQAAFSHLVAAAGVAGAVVVLLSAAAAVVLTSTTRISADGDDVRSMLTQPDI